MGRHNKKHLYEERCTTEDYFCKCKICKSAQDHAMYLKNVQEIKDIINEKWSRDMAKINKGLIHNDKPIPVEFLMELL